VEYRKRHSDHQERLIGGGILKASPATCSRRKDQGGGGKAWESSFSGAKVPIGGALETLDNGGGAATARP